MADLDDVAVGHHIFLPFDAEPPFLLGLAPAAGFQQFVRRHDLHADELLFEIAVDDARRLRRLGAALDRPCARFVLPRREEADEIKRVIRLLFKASLRLHLLESKIAQYCGAT